MQIVKIENVAQLRNTIGVQGAVVELVGYYTPDDGGGGTFYWDENSVAVDNGGTIFTTSVQGGWIRVFDDTINLKWFGAYGDGVTLSTTAVQKAFAIGKPVYVPVGTYLVGGTINILNNIYADKGAIFKTQSSFTDLFKIVEKSNLNIKNLYIDTQASSGTSSVLKIEGLRNSIIENLTIINQVSTSEVVSVDIYSGIDDLNAGYGVNQVLFLNPVIENGKVGIRTQKQPSNTEIISGFTVLGGKITSQTDFNIELQSCINFLIENVALDVILGVGYKFYNSYNGKILIGRYTSGTLSEFDFLSTYIHFETSTYLNLPSIITGENYSYKTGNKSKYKSGVDYHLEISSNANPVNPFEIKGKFGTTDKTLFTYNDDEGLKPIRLSSSNSVGSTLIGLNSFGGIVNLSTAKFSQGSAAPATGTWAVGDFRKNSNPAPSGYFGWVCTTAGTPGTWKGYGAIEP